MSHYKYLKYGIIFIVLAFISSLFYIQDSSLINTDSGIHLFRMISLSENLSHGEWLPSLHDKNMYGGGYLFDIFYPATTLYPGAIIALFGIPYKIAFLINIIIIRFVSFVLAFISSNYYFENTKKSFIFSIIYIIGFCRMIPYCYGGLFADDTSSLAFPLVFFGAMQLKKNKSWKMLAFGMCLMLYCHMLSFYLAVLFCFVYFFILNIKTFIKKDFFIPLLKATLVSMCLCVGFLIPFFLNVTGTKYRLQVNSNVWDGIKSNSIFFPALSFLADTMKDNCIRLLCLFVFVLVLCFIYRYFKKKQNNVVPFSFFALFSLYVFLSTDLFPFWIFSNISIVEIIQFGFRIANVIYVPACIFLCHLLYDHKFELSIFIIVSILFLCINMIGGTAVGEPSFYLNKKNDTYIAVGLGEFLPIDYYSALESNDYGINNYPACDYVIIDNNIETKVPVKRSWHKTTVEVPNENVDVRTYLVYYKNYKATINGTPIDVINDNGMVCINDVPAGTLEVYYKIPLYQIIVSIFSVLSFMCFVSWSIYDVKKKNKKGNP